MRRFLVIAAVGACLLAPAEVSADIGCIYGERGPAGPEDNFLLINGSEIEDQAAVVRDGSEIKVTDDQTGAVVDCVGPTPTVRNLDVIQFRAGADGAGIFVSFAGGPFSPGAPDDNVPGIQIRTRAITEFPGNIGIGGGRQDDSFFLGRGPSHTYVNLGSQRGAWPSIAFPNSIVGVLIRGGRGDDHISGKRLSDRRGPSLSVYAGRGNDRILGGSAIDFLFGRAGRDFIAGRGGADEVDCGPARDVAVRTGSDQFTGCERIRPATHLIGL